MDDARLHAAQRAAAARGLDALLIGPGADLRYLVGYDAHAMERLTMLVVPSQGDCHLVVPSLEVPAARAAGAGDLAELVAWSETDDPIRVVVDLLGGAHQVHRVAVSDRLHSVFTLRLQQALSDTTFAPTSPVLRDLRMVKDADELDALRAVGAAIDRVHAQVPGLLRPGRTERAIAKDIAELIEQEHDEVAFVIVASGPNGASPHHAAADRELAIGDAVVIDIGGVKDGYCSDCTRDYAIGEPPEGYAEMHAVLEEAQAAASAAVAPGVPACDVDRAARAVIEQAGYGERFVHRTGHGIGLEVHEEPYIVESNTEALRAGTAFSIEPGIYIPGRFGARIEDIVLLVDGRAEPVNRQPRHVTVVP